MTLCIHIFDYSSCRSLGPPTNSCIYLGGGGSNSRILPSGLKVGVDKSWYYVVFCLQLVRISEFEYVLR